MRVRRALRLRALQTANTSSAACEAVRTAGAFNNTDTSVGFALDVADLPWMNGVDPAVAIVKRLRARYHSVRSGRFALNPYHVWFICE